MKHLSRIIIALVLALLMATLLPVQVFADGNEDKYISEIKIGVGEDADEAANSLKGYVILKDDSGNNADLNKEAGGGWGSKGDRVVFLGYKKTNKRAEAITDLALMNMKGNYSVADYEALMETQMKTQIIPFVNNFITAVEEYRENYKSGEGDNKIRANYIHDKLNRYTDDDCDNAPLGDLLLNETKFEMGDAAYDALPDDEKKQHADILTIIAQANGKATLVMENLLTRAADTSDDTWLERFADLTYEDLINQTGLPPKDARKAVAKEYDDFANSILDMWEDFASELKDYKAYSEYLDNYNQNEVEKKENVFTGIDDDASTEEMTEALEGHYEAVADMAKYLKALDIVMIRDELAKIEYQGGTMLDFFTQPYEQLEDDITLLYPLAASLSAGQLAGLEFVSLRDLCLIALTNKAGYSEKETENDEMLSIYDGVDRSIYEKGGVALTYDVARTDILNSDDNSVLSGWTIAYIVISAAFALATLVSIGFAVIYKKAANYVESVLWAPGIGKEMRAEYFVCERYVFEGGQKLKTKDLYMDEVFAAKSSMCTTLSIGLGIATIIMSGLTVLSAYEDMKDHYKVDFTPIPHYMIDKKDLVGYNSKGEKVVLKNQSAYYKAVECNRKKDDEKYKMLGTSADMNGDVGSQWLALYAAKNENEAPILADSLKVVMSSDEVPADYETGIHMFGSSAAFNLNNGLYDWNQKATSVYVYFQRDNSFKSPSSAGANFTAGTLALTGGAGIVLGAVAAALVMNTKRKKESTTATV